MEQNKATETLTLENDSRAETLLGSVARWVDSRKRLHENLDTAEKGTFKDFFGCKVNKGAPFGYQALANITLTSAGYIRDKWVKYENGELKAGKVPSVYDFIIANLVPMTEEELKALAEKQKHEAEVLAKAQSYIESCELNEVEVTAEKAKKNPKLLAKFGQEVVDKIVELLEKAEKATAETETPKA